LQSAALNAGMMLVASLAAAVVTAAIVLGGLAAAIGAVVASIAMLFAPIIAAVTALGTLVYAGVRFGGQLVDGFVQGITNGRDRLVSAIRGLASQATEALRSALQIRSPSRVFAQLGVQIPAGLESRIESGTPAAQGAVDGMVEAPSMSGGRAGSSSRVAVSIGEIHVHAGESAEPRQMAASLVDELVRLLEGASIEMGVAR
jgi:hypothetical protein